MDLLPPDVELSELRYRVGLTATFFLAGAFAALVGAIGVVVEYTLSPFQTVGFYLVVAVVLSLAGGYLLRKYLEIVRE
ncbi:hypothetical protein VB773_00285 [Haloarculaceae archaeon H-GB2-1]|nr:hypothetical protein [Haloarculaceae archaeon H-GB1-1]MEA5388146.1 hypothetical protein [Haloarculaceae archaeon H-GB11]MEA5406168.1 hypothetical protein [Haloarculaceae archaeon H-GB2-1]